MKLLLALIPIILSATTKTVCTGGSCDFLDPQDAFNNTASDCAVDTIIITANQTFEGNYFAPPRACPKTVVVKSSAVSSLPRNGYRVNPTDHNALMFTLQSTVSGGTPVLRFGSTDATVINMTAAAGADITFNHTTTFNVGDAVNCSPGGTSTGTPQGFPGGLVSAQGETSGQYWIVSKVGAVLRLSNTGPTGVALVTTNSNGINGGFYTTAHCVHWEVPNNWIFWGMRLAPKPGVIMSGAMVEGGNFESRYNLPSNIHFKQIIIEGIETQDGPKLGIFLQGKNITVSDSWIGKIKMAGYDGVGIGMHGMYNYTIRNNYINATGEGIIAGGGYSYTREPATNVRITGNYIQKTADWHCAYIGSPNSSCGNAGAPSGQCYHDGVKGSYYRDTSVAVSTCAAGGCYECQSNGTWAVNTSMDFWKASTQRYTKVGVEFKYGEAIYVVGNLIRGTFGGSDLGNIACILTAPSDQGEYTVNKVRNLLFSDNHCMDIASGITFGSAPLSLFTVPNTSQIGHNNLITGLMFPALGRIGSTGADNQARGLRFYTGMQTVKLSNNTIRPSTTQTGGLYMGMVYDDTSPVNIPTYDGRIENNIYQADTYGIFASNGGAGSCAGTPSLANYLDTTGPPYRIRNNAIFDNNFATAACVSPKAEVATDTLMGFAGADSANIDHDYLASSSDYSASNAMATMLSADGGDLGADLDLIKQRREAALAGTPDWKVLLGYDLRISAPGEIKVKINSSGAQTLKVYNSRARIPANLVYSNTGATSSWTVSSLTAGTYWLKVEQGSMFWVETFVIQ